MFHYYLLEGHTAALSGLYARLCHAFLVPFVTLFSAEVTGPIFITKILHDIVTLVVLLNHAYTMC